MSDQAGDSRKPETSEKPSAKPKPSLLAVEGVSKLYPTTRGFFSTQEFTYAVNNVSFSLKSKETLGLVGESGSGKSTLGRVVLRLHEPNIGTIRFEGTNITRLSDTELRPYRKRMQMVFQDPQSSLNPRMTAAEIVTEGLSVFGMLERGKRTEKATELLEQVGLDGSMVSRYPHEFSGGQRQRLGIARAIALNPSFIVCDEPVSALDVSVQAQIINLLEALQVSRGMSYLFISHDLRVVLHTSHRIAVMVSGRIVEIGRARDVAERRAHPYTRALFAAMPEVGKKRTSLRLQGEAPTTSGPPEGCVFFSRCHKAEKGKCDKETPELKTLARDNPHRVACFFPED